MIDRNRTSKARVEAAQNAAAEAAKAEETARAAAREAGVAAEGARSEALKLREAAGQARQKAAELERQAEEKIAGAEQARQEVESLRAAAEEADAAARASAARAEELRRQADEKAGAAEAVGPQVEAAREEARKALAAAEEAEGQLGEAEERVCQQADLADAAEARVSVAQAAATAAREMAEKLSSAPADLQIADKDPGAAPTTEPAAADEQVPVEIQEPAREVTQEATQDHVQEPASSAGTEEAVAEPAPAEIATETSRATPVRAQQPVGDGGADATPAIGGYQIGAKVTSDENGDFYEAVQVKTGKAVVLKVLRQKGEGEGGMFAKLFVSAMRVVGGVRHPGLPPIFGAGCSSRGCYYATERPAAKTLSDLVASRGTGLEPRQACELVHRLASALAEWEKQGVAHGAAEPGSVVIAEDGSPRFRSLGLLEMSDRSGLSVPQRAGFLAPELAEGGEPSHRADAYSLGALLYHMLTGRLPKAGTGPDEEVLKDVPKGPAAIIRKCTAASGAQRFSGPAEMAAALEQVLKGRPSSRRRAAGGEAAKPASVRQDKAKAKPASGRQARAKPASERKVKTGVAEKVKTISEEKVAAVKRRITSRRRRRW